MKEKTYYQQFCEEYGINKKNNSIKLTEYSEHHKRAQEYDFDIFTEDQFGNIKILVYTLERETILLDNPNADPGRPSINNARDQRYYVTRYKEPKKYIDEKGKEKEKKYLPQIDGSHKNQLIFYPQN